MGSGLETRATVQTFEEREWGMGVATQKDAGREGARHPGNAGYGAWGRAGSGEGVSWVSRSRSTFCVETVVQ